MRHAEENVSRFGVFLLDVCLYIVSQCTVARLVALHYFAAALAYNNYMVVFVNDVHK